MIGRRATLVGSLGVAASAACSRKEAPPPPARAAAVTAAAPSAATPPVDPEALALDGGAGTVRATLLRFDDAPSPLVAVLTPTWGAPGVRYPVVVAFHGYAEGAKPAAEGVLGWPRDYALARAYARLRAPPLTAADFESFVTPEDLGKKNAELAMRPFGGVIAVCPYVGEAGMRTDADARAYAGFLQERLLPRVRAETPALAEARATGIDGVSLGGQFAMRVALHAASSFGALGALQPAIYAHQAPAWIELARAARARNPALRMRLVTSTEDGFREGVTRVSDALRNVGVDHEYLLLPGPHDYAFNRGPGAIELLLWHDRALR